MRLSEYVSWYALRHDVSAATIQQLKIAALLFERWASGVTLETIDDDVVNAWLVFRRDSGLSPRTVRGNRTSILMLWKDAHLHDEAPRGPRRVRLIKCPELLVDGYDRHEMGRLIAVASKLPHRFNKSPMPRRIYWRSLLLAYWDTALRLADLLSLESGWIWRMPDGCGKLVIVQAKTGFQIPHILRPATMEAIDECIAAGPKRRRIWGGIITQRHFYPAFKKLARQAGLSGTSKFIRRGSSSECDREKPGSGAKKLGHRTPGLFEKNYRVLRIVGSDVPQPPEIG